MKYFNLSNNTLTEIPNNFPPITCLDISFSQTRLDVNVDDINELKNLPPTLTELYISYNRITELKNLPPTLTKLDISYNQITELKNLPSKLTWLDISYNQITELKNLPPALTKLVISENQITELKNLPPTLTVLYIFGNQITELKNLPPTLTKLNIFGNQITELKNLPPTLTKLLMEKMPSKPKNLKEYKIIDRFKAAYYSKFIRKFIQRCHSKKLYYIHQELLHKPYLGQEFYRIQDEMKEIMASCSK